MLQYWIKTMVPSCKRSGYYNRLYIDVNLKYFRHIQAWSWSELVPFRTRLISFRLSQSELSYFLLILGGRSFRPDLVGTEGWNDGNTLNYESEDHFKKVV